MAVSPSRLSFYGGKTQICFVQYSEGNRCCCLVAESCLTLLQPHVLFVTRDAVTKPHKLGGLKLWRLCLGACSCSGAGGRISSSLHPQRLAASISALQPEVAGEHCNLCGRGHVITLLRLPSAFPALWVSVPVSLPIRTSVTLD